MAKKPTALVTGGAGFIGSNIVAELLRRKWNVRILDNFSAGKREHLEGLSASDIELVEGDIRSLTDCEHACRGVDYVFHQAALRSVPRSVDEPQVTNEVNVTGTLNMLQAAKKRGVRRLVYASSSSAYGDSKKMPQREDHTPMPFSPYAVSKLAGEHYCQTYAKTFGLETVSLRYFNVYGPNQDPESKYSALIPGFLSQLGRGEPFEVHWDGKQSRDFTYVGDVAQANLLAALAPKASGQVFNIAGGRGITVLEVAKRLVKIIGKDPGRRHTPRRQGDVRTTLASIARARRILGYKPTVKFDDGLRRTVEYFQKLGLVS
ncbi:MAG: SDR family oxidoreductase [Acidobacteria bacterium]|nr:SDR family oxidoreductase [Acidobacteriota bacterium]